MKIFVMPGIILCGECLNHLYVVGRMDAYGRLELECHTAGCNNLRKAVTIMCPSLDAAPSLRPIQELA